MAFEGPWKQVMIIHFEIVISKTQMENIYYMYASWLT